MTANPGKQDNEGQNVHLIKHSDNQFCVYLPDLLQIWFKRLFLKSVAQEDVICWLSLPWTHLPPVDLLRSDFVGCHLLTRMNCYFVPLPWGRKSLYRRSLLQSGLKQLLSSPSCCEFSIRRIFHVYLGGVVDAVVAHLPADYCTPLNGCRCYSCARLCECCRAEGTLQSVSDWFGKKQFRSPAG